MARQDRTKAEWRSILRDRLAGLDSEFVREASRTAAGHLLELPEIENAEGIFTCLSFGTEIDTWRLAETLDRKGRKVYVPRVDLESNRLWAHPWPCRLESLPFGLRQPISTEPFLDRKALDQAIDAAIIVGLGFDVRGYRLGYGRGFFDYFLADRAFPTIGFAFDLQIVDRLPNEGHDIPLDLLVSEAGVTRCRVRDGHRTG